MTEFYTPDSLIAGDHPIVTQSVTVATGQNLKRGTLLGKVSASGKVVLSEAAANDGSQTPYAVLSEDTDATDGDKTTIAYLSGEFDEDSITFGIGHTADSARDALRAINIYLKTLV
uniref:Bacteriophage lambda head decoration protein D n=1 Tax=Candidatus Kentrum sp. LFY TaxID=2126342 RepID=A0A450W7A1_9GAMM|nr:MAG: Bacteriophage lambda head decoration protein D [Candidatus Kentron sp. LFY]